MHQFTSSFGWLILSSLSVFTGQKELLWTPTKTALVADEVPGVVVVLCEYVGGWVGGYSRSTSAE